MINEIGLMNYRKLLIFFERKIPVHFRKVNGGWANGNITDLNEKMLTLVLEEFEDGMQPFLLEEIETDSIKAYTRKGEK